MKNIRQTFWLFCFAFCFCWLVACSGDRWNGGKYEGEVSINGVKPHDAKPEKFQIVTVKIPDGTMRLVKMDPANKYLANCDLQIDETYMKGVTDDARFPFTERSSVCHIPRSGSS